MIYKRLMCNYFSIGIESRIGLGFDKHRTSSAWANDMWYTWEGLKKMCCCSSTKKIRDVIDRVTSLENGQEELIFTTDTKTSDAVHRLSGNPVSLVCTNINSMMGGRTNMWRSGQGKDLGISDKEGKIFKHKDANHLSDFSSHDDDQLELQTIASVFHLPLGMAQRVTQKKGPFKIYFKNFLGEKAKKEEDKEGNAGLTRKQTKGIRETIAKKGLHTYMQIDGEYYKLINPKYI
jgi:diacylglycerol kinase (ATP)